MRGELTKNVRSCARVILLCTVRNCRLPLEQRERQFVCANNHSFDVARSGYVNLLQPQDKRSKNPGDTASAVAARRKLYARGDPLVDAIVRAFPVDGPLLDVGCGDGHHLSAFRRAYGVEACGVDISIPAIELAARSDRDCQWVVANADRFLPFADASLSAITSITARMNAGEFRRVLDPAGSVLVVLPAPDDLIELREAVLGEALERDRVERTIASFAPLFTLAKRDAVRHVTRLDREAMLDVMASSYRGLRSREREKLAGLGEMDVTLSRDLLTFRPA